VVKVQYILPILKNSAITILRSALRQHIVPSMWRHLYVSLPPRIRIGSECKNWLITVKYSLLFHYKGTIIWSAKIWQHRRKLIILIINYYYYFYYFSIWYIFILSVRLYVLFLCVRNLMPAILQIILISFWNNWRTFHDQLFVFQRLNYHLRLRDVSFFV